MSTGKPRAWRRRLRCCPGPVLLARVATLSMLAGGALALAVPDAMLIAGMHLWKPALMVSALALLGSVLAFPDWWEWKGSWRPGNHGCGARQRRASHTVDLGKARSPHARRRPDAPGMDHRPRPKVGGTLVTDKRHAHGERQPVTRRRDSFPALQRQHGRHRG